MTGARAILLAVLFLVGFSMILFPFLAFSHRVRKTLDVNEDMKRQTVRWTTVGSVWSGAAFALVAAVVMNSSSDVQFTKVGIVAVSLVVGVAWGTFLLCGTLLNIYWLRKITLPLLRKRKSENLRNRKSGSSG